jgi:hypothetical protein
MSFGLFIDFMPTLRIVSFKPLLSKENDTKKSFLDLTLLKIYFLHMRLNRMNVLYRLTETSFIHV